MLFLRGGESFKESETCEAHHGHGAHGTILVIERYAWMRISLFRRSSWKRHYEKGLVGVCSRVLSRNTGVEGWVV